MPGWDPDFDTYLTLVEEAPASFVVDLAAAQHAPLDSHPVRVQVRLTLQAPTEDGMPTPHESPLLHALEDRVTEGLAEHMGGIFVGHEISRGYLHVVAYCPRNRVGDEATLIDWLDDDGYEVAWLASDDPGWDMYFEHMYPSVWEMRTIWNRRLLARLEDHGDDLERARPIDHFAYFRGPEPAAAAAKALEKAGFLVDPPHRSEDDERKSPAVWTVEFHRDDALADGRADAVSLEIMELIDPHDGDYDGWGCAVVAATDD